MMFLLLAMVMTMLMTMIFDDEMLAVGSPSNLPTFRTQDRSLSKVATHTKRAYARVSESSYCEIIRTFELRTKHYETRPHVHAKAKNHMRKKEIADMYTIKAEMNQV